MSSQEEPEVPEFFDGTALSPLAHAVGSNTVFVYDAEEPEDRFIAIDKAHAIDLDKGRWD